MIQTSMLLNSMGLIKQTESRISGEGGRPPDGVSVPPSVTWKWVWSLIPVRVSYVKGEYFVYFKIPNMSISSQTIPLSSSLITRQSTGPHRRHHSHYLRANNSILNCRVPLSHCGGYWGFWEPALSTWQEGDGWYARDNVIQHTNNVEIAVQCSNDGSHSWSNILADKSPGGSVLLSDHLEIKWWQIKHCLNKDVPSDVIWTNQQSHWSLK